MSAQASMEEFEALLEESFERKTPEEGSVVKGTVIGIENGQAIIDVGFKVEGRIDLKEFASPGKPSELSVGDEVEVFLDRVENARGEAAISRDRARREEAWDRLESAYGEEGRVEGAIFGRVKGGFTVDLGGAVAFLPGSQIDVRPVRDVAPLMGVPQPFQILKMDRRRGNIVVSRRAVLEESRAEQRAEIVAKLKEGDSVDGVVKNVTDYGAFVDLGGVDGLLHVTDMAWRRVSHPSEIVSIGETIKVQVIKVNKETQRISLGMKQLQADPWESVEAKYPVGTTFTGRVTNITDYGAFVELEPGVEGLVHVSEMSWTKKNIHPGKIVSTSQEVEVMVLDVDPVKRRVSLGLKQTQGNPWENFAATHPSGTDVEGEVKNITEFGLFVGLEGDIDGMVHLSDLDWERPGEQVIQEFSKGDMVRAKVLDVDVEKERISLGMKQLAGDPFAEATKGVRRGQVVTVTVTAIEDGGIEVEHDGMKAFIRRSDLSRDRSEQRPDRYSVGDRVDAKITSVDKAARRLGLSIKAREIAEEKAAVEQYGSSDSGASLGDILGAALKSQAAAGGSSSASGTDEDESVPAAEVEAESAEAEAAEEATAEESSAEEAPAEGASAEESSAEEAPAEEASAEESSAEEATAEGASAEEPPAEEASAEESSAEEAPAEEASAEESSAEEPPAEEASAEESSAEEAPAEEASAEESSAEETSGKAAKKKK